MDKHREFIIGCDLDKRMAIAWNYASTIIKAGDNDVEGISVIVADYAGISLHTAQTIVQELARRVDNGK